MDRSQAAARLTAELQLKLPPIAMTFVESPPPGLKAYDGVVPSACAFWRRAENEVFYATGEQHFNCPIGAMTMGFSMPEAVQGELMKAVKLMCDCNYIGGDEPANIPSIQKEKSGIVYGPLSQFPLQPDLVLLWLSPRQAMYFSETVGKASWSAQTPSAVLGRPACAALPVSFNAGEPALSAGCMGMRTFTEISDDLLLAVVPGEELESFVEHLHDTLAVNQAMRQYYLQQKAQLAG